MESEPGFGPTKQYNLVSKEPRKAPRYPTRSLSDRQLADELLDQLEKCKGNEQDDGWLEALRAERSERVRQMGGDHPGADALDEAIRRQTGLHPADPGEDE